MCGLEAHWSLPGHDFPNVLCWRRASRWRRLDGGNETVMMELAPERRTQGAQFAQSNASVMMELTSTRYLERSTHLNRHESRTIAVRSETRRTGLVPHLR